MERYLTNLDVWCWRYREKHPHYLGLHFTAKPDACIAIKSCLQQLRREGTGAYRTIPLQMLRGSDEAKISGGRKYECYRRLRLTFHESSEKLRQMSFRVDADMACFDFVESHVGEFERGLTDVQEGTGDYSIEPQEDLQRGMAFGDLDRLSECLWFWPCFGHLWVVESK